MPEIHQCPPIPVPETPPVPWLDAARSFSPAHFEKTVSERLNDDALVSAFDFRRQRAYRMPEDDAELDLWLERLDRCRRVIMDEVPPAILDAVAEPLNAVEGEIVDLGSWMWEIGKFMKELQAICTRCAAERKLETSEDPRTPRLPNISAQADRISEWIRQLSIDRSFSAHLAENAATSSQTTLLPSGPVSAHRDQKVGAKKPKPGRKKLSHPREGKRRSRGNQERRGRAKTRPESSAAAIEEAGGDTVMTACP